MDRMKPEECPRCHSDQIGELGNVDLVLPYTDEEYREAGGRYYCVCCGWYEKE